MHTNALKLWDMKVINRSLISILLLKNIFHSLSIKRIKPLLNYMAILIITLKMTLLYYGHIPAPLEDARFRRSERFIFKAHFFIKGYSLKKKCNVEYDLLSPPQGAGLETLYTALLILRRE